MTAASAAAQPSPQPSAESPAERLALAVGGARREAWAVNARGPAGRPLVLVLHGGGGTARGLLARTAWPAESRRAGFVLVAPEGERRQWNDGRRQTATGVRSGADDVAFLDALVDAARARYRVDAGRVFLAGVSNGGLMTFRYACARPGRVAAVGPVLAKLSRAVAAACAPAPRVPLLLVAGTADPLMAYKGAPASRAARGLGSDVLTSVPETLAFWARRNGCAGDGLAGAAERPLPHRDPADPTRVRRLDVRGCPPSGAVAALVVDGGGHREPTLAPRPVRPAVERLLGRENHDVETAAAVWAFFAAAPRRTGR